MQSMPPGQREALEEALHAVSSLDGLLPVDQATVEAKPELTWRIDTGREVALLERHMDDRGNAQDSLGALIADARRAVASVHGVPVTDLAELAASDSRKLDFAPLRNRLAEALGSSGVPVDAASGAGPPPISHPGG